MKDVQVKKLIRYDLKGLFTLPIICLVRIYDSVDFWRKAYGIDGYFKMLREMVISQKMIGKFPYALEEKIFRSITF